MKNNQNITIVLLTISAAILSVMLVATMTQTSQEAQAAASVKQGDYIMVTGEISARYDALYAVDVLERRMNVYWVNPDNNRLEILATADLERAFR
ncbi:MAG: hypothetical protein ACP5HU_12280 [Phycisphaerae bacterium]